jgi:hypothetical protein
MCIGHSVFAQICRAIVCYSLKAEEHSNRSMLDSKQGEKMKKIKRVLK